MITVLDNNKVYTVEPSQIISENAFILPKPIEHFKTPQDVRYIWNAIEIFLSKIIDEKNNPNIIDNPILLNCIFAVYYIQNYFFEKKIGNVNMEDYQIFGKDIRSICGIPAFIVHLYHIGVEIYENNKPMDNDFVDYNFINPEQETIDELKRLHNITSNQSCKDILMREINKLIMDNCPQIFNFLNEIKSVFNLLEIKRKKTHMQY